MLAARWIGQVMHGVNPALEREHREQQDQRETERAARAADSQRGEAREQGEEMPGRGDRCRGRRP